MDQVELYDAKPFFRATLFSLVGCCAPKINSRELQQRIIDFVVDSVDASSTHEAMAVASALGQCAKSVSEPPVAKLHALISESLIAAPKTATALFGTFG